MNFFTWSREDNDLIVPENQFNRDLKNWWGPLQSGKSHAQNLNNKGNIEDKLSKYAVYVKFNGIPREVNTETPI